MGRDARDLIDTPEPAVLSTLNADGSPHLCVAWIAREGDDLPISKMSHRRQHRTLRREPRTGPRCYVQVRGRAQPGGERADELIRALRSAFLGVARRELIGDRERALMTIIPEQVGMHA